MQAGLDNLPHLRDPRLMPERLEPKVEKKYNGGLREREHAHICELCLIKQNGYTEQNADRLGQNGVVTPNKTLEN